jgi:hypothetical protein
MTGVYAAARRGAFLFVPALLLLSLLRAGVLGEESARYTILFLQGAFFLLGLPLSALFRVDCLALTSALDNVSALMVALGVVALNFVFWGTCVEMVRRGFQALFK